MSLQAKTTAEQNMLAVLEQWQGRGWIRALDLSFAKFICEVAEEHGESPSPLLVLLAALVSHQVGRGHVCLELNQLLSDPLNTLVLPPENGESDPSVPKPGDLLAGVDVDKCIEALTSCNAVSDGSQATPLVLSGSRLYLRRYWRYERQIAAGIQQRLSVATDLDDPKSPKAASLAQALDVLFQQQAETDYQKIACALAARKRFSVITGGPGTGKTTTVVKLLAALQSVAANSESQDTPNEPRKHRIRLAAPTGKAAARLNESIAGAVSQLPLSELPGKVSIEDIPTKVTTLHRLLGSRPNTRRLRHNRDNPLLVDILVIDEASMVDVELMAVVFEALPGSAQLILLGDKDQLASVDAGAVLGELCQRADQAHYTPETAQWLQQITGYDIPEQYTDEEGTALDQAVAMLRKSYRFGQDSGIRILADAVNQNRLTDDLLHKCANHGFPDVAWLNGNQQQTPDQTLRLLAQHALTGTPKAFGLSAPRHSGEETPVGYAHYLNVLKAHNLTAESPTAAWDTLARQTLTAFNQFQILCALRKGPWGVQGINQLIAQQLQTAGLIPKTEGWYTGRPVLITANDYNLGLMNGDIGITLQVPWDQDEDGNPKNTLRVVFPAGDGTDAIRWISPSRLQELETVYAMTVHKAQGSEFGHCCLALPDKVSPVLTRELVYTGITRAKKWLSLSSAGSHVLKEATGQKVKRASGLFADHVKLRTS